MSTVHGRSRPAPAEMLQDARAAWAHRRLTARAKAPARHEPTVGTAAIVNVVPVRDWRDVLVGLAANQAPRIPRVTRGFECLVAASLLIVTAPIMLIVAAIIWCDSPGPVFFRHRRVGANGRLFEFTKFRTLYADAKERWPELYAYAYSPEQVETLHFKIQNDPRVTRVGRWLRKSTLDELPNLWHVFTGEMALVGPRPEIPEMLPYYDAGGLRKFSVRPGVTGLAQVSGRGNLSFHDTVKCDVAYVDRRSAWLDLKIVAATVSRTICREGAF